MANLAIKGYQTRGDEVIEILEMLGGKNDSKYNGETELLCYYITENGQIECDTDNEIPFPCTIFTIEEFIEKYPYKVWDKVRFSDSNTPFTISRIWWDNNASELICTLEEQDIDISSVDLQPYKEEVMKKEISVAIVNRFICLEGYDFYDDKGNIIDTKEITMKKQSKYPKAYDECLEILGYNASHTIPMNHGHKGLLFMRFQRLLICRDAYWKIAGWKPSKDNLYEDLYCIGFNSAVITFKMQGGHALLSFPTEEMRDAFYENFKELIEECKELL